MDHSDSPWPPPARVLLLGPLGDAPSRRFHYRSILALVGYAAATCATTWLASTFFLLRVAIAAVAFGHIVWQFRVYLGQADELARKIHLEAMGWTYPIALWLGVTFGVVAKVYGWTLNPGLLILLEPVRAAVLYLVARQYQ
jgi:hypothetical protein